MTQPLAPCPSCSRHVRTSETSCPFCKSALPDTLTAVPGSTQRLTRAAAFAFSTSIAVVAVACGGIAEEGTDAGSSSDSAASDAPATDAGKTDAAGNDASTNDAAKTDAAKPDAGPGDDGGVQPPYGAPAYGQPPVDGG